MIDAKIRQIKKYLASPKEQKEVATLKATILS